MPVWKCSDLIRIHFPKILFIHFQLFFLVPVLFLGNFPIFNFNKKFLSFLFGMKRSIDIGWLADWLVSLANLKTFDPWKWSKNRLFSLFPLEQCQKNRYFSSKATKCVIPVKRKTPEQRKLVEEKKRQAKWKWTNLFGLGKVEPRRKQYNVMVIARARASELWHEPDTRPMH